jgi:hypothetical protein
MGHREKVVDSILNNPRGVRFDNACTVSEWLGFIEKRRRTGSSHRTFARPGEPTLLNFQKTRDGLLKPYQARQLIAMIEKYRDEI